MFSLESFLEKPTWDAVSQCKKDLTQIACHFNTSAASSRKKDAVFTVLVEKQILTGDFLTAEMAADFDILITLLQIFYPPVTAF